MYPGYMVVVIGAGLAGLVCARVLQQAGVSVTVIEREIVPGGRLRTERHPEGFLLDHGFQVLFTAYPAARRHLSYSRLSVMPFVPGALVARDGRLFRVADPRREPRMLLSSLWSPVFGFADKLRVLRLAAATRRSDPHAIFAASDSSTEDYLRSRGFSDRFIDSFARPLYGGIFLDRSLATSAAMFRFTFKMLSEGETVVPARGMQEIPEQLAQGLQPDTIQYSTTVESITREHGRASGVRTADGRHIGADNVVVATDPHTAARLLGDESVPRDPVSSTTAYFAGTASLYDEPMIVLNATPDPYVNTVVQIDNIAREYAPAGHHLVSLSLARAAGDSDQDIERQCREELASLFPAKPIDALRLLRIFRIPFSQFAQPPGIFQHLPSNTSDTEGLYLASEATSSSSIQGAMSSGEAVARHILDFARVPATA